MPLPAMTGDPETMLGGGPGMMGMGSSQGGGQESEINPQDQVRGAVQQLGTLRQQTTQVLEAIATQFPDSTKEANDLKSAFDQALANLMRKLVKSSQAPEPQAPRVIR